jgi:hypothetical protein
MDIEYVEPKPPISENLLNKTVERGDNLRQDVVQKLLRKIDWWLMPALGIFILFLSSTV